MKTPKVAANRNTIMALQNEIRRSEEAMYEHRVHAMLLVAHGMSCREVGMILGDAPRTVAYWVRRFESEGLAGLTEGERPGRPPRLNEEQITTIEAALQKDPSEFGLHGLWGGKTLSCFIWQQWGAALGVRQCQRLFRQLGFQRRKLRSKKERTDPDDQGYKV